jgi:hypothetical protein
MGILFGLFILVIFFVAFYNRRRQNKSWLKEERHEESGHWIDKRSGERGTYGSLDAIREAERHSLSRQSRIGDAVLDMRNYAFEHFPGFHERSDEQIRAFATAARGQVSQLFDTIDKMKTGLQPEAPETAPADDPHSRALKKMMLDAAYAQFPWLLDLDIETIKQLDRLAGSMAEALIRQPV